jgi:thiamine biosynthesis lipoprotein
VSSSAPSPAPQDAGTSPPPAPPAPAARARSPLPADAVRLPGPNSTGRAGDLSLPAGKAAGAGSAQAATAGTVRSDTTKPAAASGIVRSDTTKPAEASCATKLADTARADVLHGAAAARPREARVVRGRFGALGTYGELLLDGRPDALGTAMRILWSELLAIDLACSRFRRDSELMAVNAAAGRTVRVSPLFAEAVQTALVAAEQTGGDVDPMLGRAMVAAGYDDDYAALPADGPAAQPAPPPADAWRQVDLAPGTVRIPPGTALDLGATAKALAVDRIATAVAAETGAGVLVNVGGDLATAGPVPPAGWPVRLTDDTAREDVTRPGRTGPVVRIHGGGLATSSTAVRCWRRGDTAYHHVLDPRTGLPAEPVWRTVTVTAASCVDANTASTAAIVRGRPALHWLAALGLPSRLVGADGTVHRVAGWPANQEGAA